jgi:hypothetical protein
VQTDDTTVNVLDPTLDQTRQGRLWTYLGEDGICPLTVFEYTPNHKRDGPAKFLEGYQGYLVADAFSGYDAIFVGSQGTIVEIACWAHARRKFHEARGSDAARSTIALAMIGQLYHVERQAKKKAEEWEEAEWARRSDEDPSLPPRPERRTPEEEKRFLEKLYEVRKELREQWSRPALKAIHQWLTEQSPTSLPKSPVGEAIRYALNNWDALERYLEHPWLPIDNNASERAVKNVVIGRKNWLFAGSDNGGRTAATLFSFTVSCKQNGVDPFAYLRDILDRLATHPASDIDSLLPDRWQPPVVPASA